MAGMKLFADIARLVEEGRGFVVATVIETAGSTPQKPCSRMVVLEDGGLRGTIGGGAIEKQVIEEAGKLFQAPESSRVMETHLTHDLGMCCGGKMKIFLEKHTAAARLYLFGAGHVGKELAQLAHHVGFRVTVIDERPAWANRERFAEGIALELADPAAYAKQVEGGPAAYFCIATHDHPLDQAVVEALLRKPFAYLGLIGSMRKAERFKLRLRAAEFTEEELARIHSPMGVPINALTPEEIAVSVVGELIAMRRKDVRLRKPKAPHLAVAASDEAK